MQSRKPRLCVCLCGGFRLKCPHLIIYYISLYFIERAESEAGMKLTHVHPDLSCFGKVWKAVSVTCLHRGVRPLRCTGVRHQI